MKTKAAVFVSALLTLLSLSFATPAFAKKDKVEVCHLTSSATNPSVLINVSVSAARAHYDHGDPASFTVLPGGHCSAGGTTAPTVEAFLSDDNIYTDETTVMSWEASADAVECSLGNGETVGSVVLGPYAPGVYTFNVTCVNAAEIEATASVQLTVRELTPPPR